MKDNRKRTFRPSATATVTLLLLTVLFTNLGIWQSRRALEKTALEQQFEHAASLSLEQAMTRGERFARIQASGHFDDRRHILLDNQVWKGRAGVHVFTPFRTISGAVILVNRGWLPLGAGREVINGIPTPTGQVIVRGILNTPPVPGRMLGEADKIDPDRWPQLVTYLNITDISRAMDTQLASLVVQLAESEPAGFDGRDWQPVFLSSKRHKGYAFQWFSLALACISLWLFIGIRRARDFTQ